MHEEEQYAVRAIRAGAQGYLTKESAGTQLVGAIRKVASGRPYISTELAEQLALEHHGAERAIAAQTAFGPRIRGIFALVAGKSITEIAELLHLSVKTVSTHKTRIMQKMGMTFAGGNGPVCRGTPACLDAHAAVVRHAVWTAHCPTSTVRKIPTLPFTRIPIVSRQLPCDTASCVSLPSVISRLDNCDLPDNARFLHRARRESRSAKSHDPA